MYGENPQDHRVEVRLDWDIGLSFPDRRLTSFLRLPLRSLWAGLMFGIDALCVTEWR